MKRAFTGTKSPGLRPWSPLTAQGADLKRALVHDAFRWPTLLAMSISVPLVPYMAAKAFRVPIEMLSPKMEPMGPYGNSP